MSVVGSIVLVMVIVAIMLLVRLILPRLGSAAERFGDQPWATVGLAVLAGCVGLGLLAPWLAPYDPARQLDIIGLANQAPSSMHWLGTDLLSRDIWSRVLHGARVSLGIGALATVVAVLVGGMVGLVAGYCGGIVDAVLMRLVDVGLAIPRIFTVLVAIALWEHVGMTTLILILGLTGWFGTSRLVRAEVMVLRHGPMIASGIAIGASPLRIVTRHLLPSVATPLIVAAALGVGNVMLLEAALSFLGVGVQPPTPSWGNMIADGRDQLASAPWVTVFPGLAIVTAVMAVNAVGDGLRAALDPRTPGYLSSSSSSAVSASSSRSR